MYLYASHSEEVNQAAGMLLKKMSRLKPGNELYGYVGINVFLAGCNFSGSTLP